MPSSDYPAVVRQWTLLQSLSNRHYGMTLQEMSDETGVTTRTIRRDLALLQEVGFPVSENHKSDHGRRHWQLDPSAKKISLSFDWEEAMALYFGRRYLDPLAGTMLWQSLNRAFRKIEACLGDRALRHIRKMKGAFHHVQFGTSDYHDKSEIIDQLSLAVEERSMTLLTYHSRSSTEPVTYDVYPYGLVHHRHSLYLIGFSTTHDEIRTFKVDRIERVDSDPLKFQRPVDFDLKKYLADGFGIFHGTGPLTMVRIRFSADVARVVSESQWHASQKLSRQADGSLIAQFELGDLHEITSWILSFGSKAVVIEPEELRESIAEELRQALSQLEMAS